MDRTQLIKALAHVVGGSAIGALTEYLIRDRVSWLGPTVGGVTGAGVGALRYYDLFKKDQKNKEDQKKEDAHRSKRIQAARRRLFKAVLDKSLSDEINLGAREQAAADAKVSVPEYIKREIENPEANRTALVRSFLNEKDIPGNYKDPGQTALASLALAPGAVATGAKLLAAAGVPGAAGTATALAPAAQAALPAYLAADAALTSMRASDPEKRKAWEDARRAKAEHIDELALKGYAPTVGADVARGFGELSNILQFKSSPTRPIFELLDALKNSGKIRKTYRFDSLTRQSPVSVNELLEREGNRYVMDDEFKKNFEHFKTKTGFNPSQTVELMRILGLLKSEYVKPKGVAKGTHLVGNLPGPKYNRDITRNLADYLQSKNPALRRGEALNRAYKIQRENHLTDSRDRDFWTTE